MRISPTSILARARMVAASFFSYGPRAIREAPGDPQTSAARSALGRLTPLSIALLTTLALAISGCAVPVSPVPTVPSQSSLLPREAIIPLDAVKAVVPEMSKESATGENQTAVGNPTGNRSVTYATSDGSQRVVISVDQYPSAQAASSAYQQAYQASLQVPGVKGEPVPGLGDSAFIGVITQGTETHVGGGAVFADRIVTVTLQAYDATDENKAKVVALIRKQAAAKQTP